MENTIYGLSNFDYHNTAPYTDYLSSTQLKFYLRSPKYFRYKLDNPEEEKSDALAFGSLFHELMASLAEHNADWGKAMKGWSENLAFFIPPLNSKGKPFGATSNAYKEAYEKFLQDNESKTIISESDYDLVTSMALSLLNGRGATSEQVRKLLKWGKPEVSIFYETKDGIRLKIRPDLLTNGKIIDWKTTTLDDLTEKSINGAILKYAYHVSAAMYQWVAHEVLGKWLDFYLVFVQKQPPFDSVMVNMSHGARDPFTQRVMCYGYHYDATDDIVEPGCGALEFQHLLDLHTRCVKSGEWPGAESFIPGDKYRIMEIEPPKYYTNKFFESESYY